MQIRDLLEIAGRVLVAGACVALIEPEVTHPDGWQVDVA